MEQTCAYRSQPVFYAYAEPRTLLPLGLSLLVNYIFSKLLESEKLRWRRFFLAVPVCINAALLLYFKYLNFAITNYNALFHTDHALKTLLLPVGISFSRSNKSHILSRRTVRNCSKQT